ncbi:histone deacetylase [Streptomyces capparidis]
MSLARLAAYLGGGCPPGGARHYPGCRDPRPPAGSVPVHLPGRLYFALESRTWTGGMAFHDPDAGGRTAARAHLLTLAQFSDIAAQEMGREPGRDLDLAALLRHGRMRIGDGRYETLVCTGLLDGLPVVTFTAPWAMADVPKNAPAPAYLRHLAAGLAQAHGWDGRTVAAYLADCPGVADRWTADDVAALLAAPAPGEPRPALTP